MKRRDFIKVGAVVGGLSVLDLRSAKWAHAAQNKVLNIVVQPEPPGIQLGIYQNGPSQMIAGNIYDGLLRYDENLTPEPNLATSWEVSDDKLKYTFHLKEGVTWHDGEPFTAHDVVFSADDFLRQTHARHRTNMDAVESIEALDDHTVVFTLKNPVGPFMGIFEVGSMPMIPKHIYEGTEYRDNPANNHPIGTGPFKFKEWRKGSYIHLVRNDNYHESELPYIDEVYFHVIPDAVSRAAAYESGRVDVLPGGSVEYFDLPRITELPDTEVTEKGWEFFSPLAWMWLNNRIPAFQDKRARQAAMYALDRQAMVDVVMQGYGKVATGPFHSSVLYHTDEGRQYEYNPDKARELLKESGYNGEKLTMIPLPYGEAWQRIAEMARQNLIDAGFNIELVATDLATRNQRIENWDFDISFTYLYQYGDAALGVSRNYISSAINKGSLYNNVEGYENPEIDRLFAEGAIEVDPEKRAAIYEEVQKILCEDVPIAWLFEMSFPTVYRSRVENIVNSAVGINDGLARTRMS